MNRITVEFDDTSLEGEFFSIHPDYQAPTDPDITDPNELFDVRFSMIDDELGKVWVSGWLAFDIRNTI